MTGSKGCSSFLVAFLDAITFGTKVYFGDGAFFRVTNIDLELFAVTTHHFVQSDFASSKDASFHFDCIITCNMRKEILFWMTLVSKFKIQA